MKPESIKDLLEEVLRRLGVKYEEIVVFTETSIPKFVIKSSESGMLIGTKGENLGALNHLLKRLVSKGSAENSEAVKFFVDVNDYQERLLEDLKTKIKIMSERAKSFKIDVELEPMSSYERMHVHSILEGTPNIKTESVGAGRERHVVIRYIESDSPSL